MADEWSELVFEPALYGGNELDIVGVDDDFSNELIRHLFPFRNGAVLQNAGAVPRTTACEIVFFERPELSDNHIERLSQFLVDAASDKPLTFIHPLYGSYQARVEDCRATARAVERSWIALACTFVEDGLNPAAFEAPQDESVGAGVAEVDLRGVNVTAAIGSVTDASVLAALDEKPLTVQDEALATAQSWADNADITQRQVNLELNAITNEIDSEIDRLGLSLDVSRFDSWVALVRLHGSIRRAADLAVRTAPKLRTHLVKRTEPLFSILVEIYGGADIVDRYNRTLQLNDIDNPARVLVGTLLTVET